jgi:DNA polymerase III alpha subunit (gram-positive type)
MKHTSNTKPKGYFEKLLAMDCETTGLVFGSSPVCNPKTGEHHQAVSWGFVVADAETLEPIEKLYVEIKWNKNSKQQRAKDNSFGTHAEKIHGLTYDYLEANGITEQQALEKIGNLIISHWGTTCMQTLGHNVHLFDLPFLRDLFERHAMELPVGNRHYDSSSLGFGITGSFNSDDLFYCLGLEDRENHNALQDAEHSLEVFRIARLLWKAKVGITAYD